MKRREFIAISASAVCAAPSVASPVTQPTFVDRVLLAFREVDRINHVFEGADRSGIAFQIAQESRQTLIELTDTPFRFLSKHAGVTPIDYPTTNTAVCKRYLYASDMVPLEVIRQLRWVSRNYLYEHDINPHGYAWEPPVVKMRRCDSVQWDPETEAQNKEWREQERVQILRHMGYTVTKSTGDGE